MPAKTNENPAKKLDLLEIYNKSVENPEALTEEECIVAGFLDMEEQEIVALLEKAENAPKTLSEEERATTEVIEHFFGSLNEILEGVTETLKSIEGSVKETKKNLLGMESIVTGMEQDIEDISKDIGLQDPSGFHPLKPTLH